MPRKRWNDIQAEHPTKRPCEEDSRTQNKVLYGPNAIQVESWQCAMFTGIDVDNRHPMNPQAECRLLLLPFELLLQVLAYLGDDDLCTIFCSCKFSLQFLGHLPIWKTVLASFLHIAAFVRLRGPMVGKRRFPVGQRFRPHEPTYYYDISETRAQLPTLEEHGHFDICRLMPICSPETILLPPSAAEKLCSRILGCMTPWDDFYTLVNTLTESGLQTQLHGMLCVITEQEKIEDNAYAFLILLLCYQATQITDVPNLFIRKLLTLRRAYIHAAEVAQVLLPRQPVAVCLELHVPYPMIARLSPNIDYHASQRSESAMWLSRFSHLPVIECASEPGTCMLGFHVLAATDTCIVATFVSAVCNSLGEANLNLQWLSETQRARVQASVTVVRHALLKWQWTNFIARSVCDYVEAIGAALQELQDQGRPLVDKAWWLPTPDAMAFATAVSASISGLRSGCRDSPRCVTTAIFHRNPPQLLEQHRMHGRSRCTHTGPQGYEFFIGGFEERDAVLALLESEFLLPC